MTDRELNKLVEAHLPLVNKTVRRYSAMYHIEPEDLLDRAYEIVTEAVQKWQPDKGASFGSYLGRFLPQRIFWECKRIVRKRKKLECLSLDFTPQSSLGTPVSFVRPSHGKNLQHKTFAEAVATKCPTCYQEQARRQAWNVIATLLDTREWMILAYHIGLDPLPRLTLEEIGQRLNVSRQAVHQIEVRALRKLRDARRQEAGRDALEALREYALAKSA